MVSCIICVQLHLLYLGVVLKNKFCFAEAERALGVTCDILANVNLFRRRAVWSTF